MKNTRFMEVMFSNTDEELAKQVDSDIKKASEDGSVDTEEVRYDKTADGNVAITDKENGEVTIAEKDPNEADTYNLVAVPDEQLERFVHPSADGHPSDQVGAPDEKLEDHFQEGCVISPNLPDGGLNPEAGHERRIEDMEHCENCEDREFSVTSDNDAWQKVFSMPQEFCEMLFSEVIESSEVSKVGDLKVEKCADEPNSVIVTSESTGDQVKITLDEENMEVTELDNKNFSDGQFLPYYIIGISPYDHYIADAQEWGLTNAEDLKAQLEEDGIESVQIFDNQDEARDYAFNLLSSVGADPEEGDVDEPEEQKEYSDSIGASSVYTHSYRTDDTVFMSRMFSEDAVGISETKEAVENAIEDGDEVDLEGATITPIDDETAIIEDGGEYTKATKEGDDMILDSVEEDEAKDLLEDAEEKKYSGIYTDESETRFFSEYEDMTAYMERIFSEESDQDIIEDAIANGDEIENDTEIITPIDSKTAVVEDKDNGEFTKVTLLDEDQMNIHPIEEEEANDLIENIKVEDDDDEDEDEKEFSEIDLDGIYSNLEGTKFFSEYEEISDYMERLYSDEADQDEIEDAIEEGEQVENDNEVITPIDSKTAVIEDKNSGEFTKAEIKDDSLEVNKISEEEADDLTENLKVEKSEEDIEEEEEEKKYSVLGKFFADVVASTQPQQQVAQVDPNQQQVAPASMPNQQEMAVNEQVEQQATVEDIEDKALAAVQSIKAAAEEASAQIMDAKAAPVQEADPEIQEAQFSEKTFSQYGQYNPLVSWLEYK